MMFYISIIKYGIKVGSTAMSVFEAYKFWIEYKVGSRIKDSWKALKSKFNK